MQERPIVQSPRPPEEGMARALFLPVEFMDPDLSTESIAVNAHHLGRPALVAVGLRQHDLDKLLFEDADGFVQKNPFLYHFSHERLQHLSHGGLPLS